MSAGTSIKASTMALCFLLVLAVIFMVPVLVYGAASSLTGLPVPGGSPIIFLAGVLVSKMGTAFAFVALFYMARNAFADRWLQYAFVWWLMFAFGEVGQAIGPDYSWAEALAGLISEAIYFPLSAYLASWLFGNQIPLQKTAR